MITEVQLHAVLLDVHRAIEEAATSTTHGLSRHEPLELAYPPNGGLSSPELEALRQIAFTPPLISALRKVFADTAATPLFHLFALLDGVADPPDLGEPWLGATLQPVDDTTNETFLHDDFFDTYWAWRRQRPDPGWRLDQFDGA